MFHRKMIEAQLQSSGVRIGDSCSIYPSHGRRKAFTLNRTCIDLISSRYRPQGLALSYVELPCTEVNEFHYRLELEGPSEAGRFVLKTMKGRPFWLNGHAAREAYVERHDRLYVDDNKIGFNACDLGALTSHHFDHEILQNENLLRSNLNILVEGETGTGKTDLASKIHQRSGRVGQFVAVNLSSFNPQLIESELFGHKKGSFTGAISDKSGAFALASHGTLFLDEIDSLPWEFQTKLLTFLDTGRFRRVGDTQETEAKARLIFASGRRLQPLVEQGTFRKDFFYRLMNGHALELRSLRNDVSRIREACQYFALKHSVTFSERVIEFYQTLAWPGNLRQLFGHLEKKRVLGRSTRLDFDTTDEELMLQSSDLMSLEAPGELVSLERHKADYVRRALGVCDGSVARAARKLCISEKTVRSLLTKGDL